MLRDRSQQTPRKLTRTPEADPQALGYAGCGEQGLLSLLLEKETTEQMTSFTVDGNVTCKVFGVEGCKAVLWFLTVILKGSFLPNYTHGLGNSPKHTESSEHCVPFIGIAQSRH